MDGMIGARNTAGVLATLLAVTGVVTVADAANAVGLTADDLVAEAEAWAMGAQGDDVDGLDDLG
jgi:hypothetical protein